MTDPIEVLRARQREMQRQHLLAADARRRAEAAAEAARKFAERVSA